MTPPAAPPDIPVFSPRLDDLMAAMLKGEAPNVGRFCGYCYTPVPKAAGACAHCGRSSVEYPPQSKIPPEFFALYKNMRKRESLIVNSFAFGGLALAVLLFVVLVAVAVYVFDQSLWWLAAATVVLIVGGRIFAGLLGGWIGDSVGYDYAHSKLVAEWLEYEGARERDRRGAAGRVDELHAAATNAAQRSQS